jgi:hypothetical protein
MAEMVACPSCRRTLQVPEQYLGQKVECPECQHRFEAASSSVSAQPMPAPTAENAGASKPRRFEDEEDDLPRRRRASYDGDFDDDDDDIDGLSRVRRGRYPQHRGGLILALGLIALIGGWMFWLPLVLGPVAWVMGRSDLHEIREGRMDPEGLGLTQAGHVLGIIASVFLIVILVGFGLVVVLIFLSRR